MTDGELIDAMRHGTGNPRLRRSPQDLGRFGLSLKRASSSQCRSLTVVSAGDGAVCGAEWSLDRIGASGDKILSILDDADIHALPYTERLGTRGTAVIWRQLDRLMEDEAGVRRDELVYKKLAAVCRHLQFVCHRFLSAEVRRHTKISPTINGHQISEFDPFCRNSPATQALPEDMIRIGEVEVRRQSYVLPRHGRLSVTDYAYYQHRADFVSNHSRHVYRSGRLMAWGDWFRLVPKGEATKLARDFVKSSGRRILGARIPGDFLAYHASQLPLRPERFGLSGHDRSQGTATPLHWLRDAISYKASCPMPSLTFV